MIEMAVSDADVAERVLFVGEDFINSFQQTIDLHGRSRVDQEPVVRGVGALFERVAPDKKCGDWDVYAAGDGPDDGASI